MPSLRTREGNRILAVVKAGIALHKSADMYEADDCYEVREARALAKQWWRLTREFLRAEDDLMSMWNRKHSSSRRRHRCHRQRSPDRSASHSHEKSRRRGVCFNVTVAPTFEEQFDANGRKEEIEANVRRLRATVTPADPEIAVVAPQRSFTVVEEGEIPGDEVQQPQEDDDDATDRATGAPSPLSSVASCEQQQQPPASHFVPIDQARSASPPNDPPPTTRYQIQTGGCSPPPLAADRYDGATPTRLDCDYRRPRAIPAPPPQDAVEDRRHRGQDGGAIPPTTNFDYRHRSPRGAPPPGWPWRRPIPYPPPALPPRNWYGGGRPNWNCPSVAAQQRWNEPGRVEQQQRPMPWDW